MRNTTRTTRRDEGSTRPATLLVLLAMALLAPVGPSRAQVAPVQPTVKYAQGGAGKITGIIVARQGDDILLRDGDTGALSVITLASGTRISSPTGFLNLDRKSQNVTSLIPGLVIVVNGQGGPRGNLIADRIGFRKSALRTASAINASQMIPNNDQRALAYRAQANADSIAEATTRARGTLDSLETTIKQRMSELDTYDVKFSSVVNFETGKAVLDDAAKTDLTNLVAQGVGLNGYIIEVAGFADTTGRSAANQRLSERRADAVVEYLTQVLSVPLRRIVNPTGLGTSHAVATNTTPEGRALNRRVEVKVLVNRALGGR